MTQSNSDSTAENGHAGSGTDGSPAAGGSGNSRRKRKRRTRLFPNMAFEEALFLSNAIQRHASGQEVRRLTLFEALKRSPDSGQTRKLITASAQYGLTNGAYNAHVLSLTNVGSAASDPSVPEHTKAKALIELAVLNIAPF